MRSPKTSSTAAAAEKIEPARLQVFDLKEMKNKQSLKKYAATRASPMTMADLPLERLLFLDRITSKTAHEIKVPDGETGALKGIDDIIADLTAAGAGRLLNDAWARNHYRWVLLQLKAQSLRFIELCEGYWVYERVLERMRYRYEVELNQGKRSIVARVIEQDASALTTMVLCVSDIAKGATAYTLELTDGWHRIYAAPDRALEALVNAGRIFVGRKLRVSLAQLAPEIQPVGALEVTEAIQLKLFVNGVAPMPWHAKLGQPRRKGFPKTPLAQIVPDGGPVSEIDVVVTRQYPPTFLETLPGGGKRIVSERENAALEREHAADRERARVRVYAEKEREKRQEPMQTSGGSADLRNIAEQDGDAIYEAMLGQRDQQAFVLGLPLGARQRLDEAMSRHAMEKQQALMGDVDAEVDKLFPPRDAVKKLKFMVTDAAVPEGCAKSNALITVWRPHDGFAEALPEGTRVKIRRITASKTRDHHVHKPSTIHLTHSKMTEIELVAGGKPSTAGANPPAVALSGTAVPVESLFSGDELDILGVVVDIQDHGATAPAGGRPPTHHQKLFVSDASKSVVVVEVHAKHAACLPSRFLAPPAVVLLRSVTLESFDPRFGFAIFKAGEDAEIIGASEYRAVRRYVSEEQHASAAKWVGSCGYDEVMRLLAVIKTPDAASVAVEKGVAIERDTPVADAPTAAGAHEEQPRVIKLSTGNAGAPLDSNTSSLLVELPDGEQLSMRDFEDRLSCAIETTARAEKTPAGLNEFIARGAIPHAQEEAWNKERAMMWEANTQSQQAGVRVLAYVVQSRVVVHTQEQRVPSSRVPFSPDGWRALVAWIAELLDVVAAGDDSAEASKAMAIDAEEE